MSDWLNANGNRFERALFGWSDHTTLAHKARAQSVPLNRL